jgi:hypothetical protein
MKIAPMMGRPARRPSAGARGRRTLCAAIAAMLLLCARPASPAVAVAGRVVVLQQNPLSASARRCLTRIREELVAGGFDVTLAEFAAGVDPLWVVDPRNPRDDSLATLALIGDPEVGASELWIVDRIAGGRSAIRRIMVPAGGAGHGAEVVAIRALEFLRASTLELPASSPGGAPPAPTIQSVAAVAVAAPPTPVEAAPAGRPLALEAGISVLDSAGVIEAAIVPLARLRLELSRLLAARLTLAGLGSRPRLSSAVGSASIAQDLGLLELVADFRPGKRLRPSVSAGAGALAVSVDGQGALPYEGRDGRRWAALLDGGVGISAAIQRGLAVAVELHALLAAPYPTVRFAGVEAARLGRPSLLASITLVTPL